MVPGKRGALCQVKTACHTRYVTSLGSLPATNNLSYYTKATAYRYDMFRFNLIFCSDEIYALSVYDPTAPPFISALTLTHRLVGDGALDQEQVDTYVHLVYGLSKDWCGSGLRVGMLYSRNQPLQEALNSLAAFGSISNHTQHVLAEVLSDAQWTDTFVKENSQLLRESYTALTQKLDAVGIPYVHAVAGMFIWIDLRKYLGENTWEGEAALWSKVCEEAKVILTPGESCHASEPGYFRLCFAWVAKEALEDAVTRLQQTLAIS